MAVPPIAARYVARFELWASRVRCSIVLLFCSILFLFLPIFFPLVVPDTVLLKKYVKIKDSS